MRAPTIVSYRQLLRLPPPAHYFFRHVPALDSFRTLAALLRSPRRQREFFRLHPGEPA